MVKYKLNFDNLRRRNFHLNIVFNINFDPKRSSEKETNRWILYYYLKHKYKLQQYSFFHSLNKNLYDSISEQHLV